MNELEPGTIRCACGHVYEVEIVTALHVTRRSALRQAILDGESHRFPCSQCHQANLVSTPLPHTDFSRRHWFTLFPTAYLPWRGALLRACHDTFRTTMLERSPPLVQSWAPEFLQRAFSAGQHSAKTWWFWTRDSTIHSRARWTVYLAAK